MLLDFSNLFNKYHFKVKGVIQVGAHRGQENGLYVKHGIENIVYVEPSSKNFSILQSKFNGNPSVILFNVACGEVSGEEVAYLDTTNQGMSSSLLKPKVHLEQHKEVIFDDAEVWTVKRLDDLPIEKEKYNLLNMDVQGFEDRVLRGATETLKHIDYIFTEVNRHEMYEGCAMVEDLDKLLPDFQRVETGWASETHGWGDSLLVRKTLLNAQ